MSSKRDFVTEILDQRSRLHTRGKRWERFSRRITPLTLTLNELKTTKTLSDRARTELFRYFPIATIAGLQGYFGHVYRDLINAGPPYIGRAAQFKDFKFGIEPILAIHGRFITAGELIAHLLPHNSLQISKRT